MASDGCPAATPHFYHAFRVGGPRVRCTYDGVPDPRNQPACSVVAIGLVDASTTKVSGTNLRDGIGR